jgi:ABC-type multidrug transport system, ATPase component
MSLHFTQIHFRYRRSRRPIFDDFSWEVPAGRTVLLGPNGAGKSTLLALGADALRPHRGAVRLPSLAHTQNRRRGSRAAYRRAVGWMPQQIRPVPGLTIHEQVAYAGWLKGLPRSQAWSAAATALEQVALIELAGRKTATLSGGQLRRVGLAQVLIHDPQIILLDEPTAGLDPAQRSRFRELLVALPPDRPVVVSTHQVDDLSDLFDTVVVLDHGHVRFSGSVAAFMDLATPSAGERRAEAAYAQIVSEKN